MRTNEVDKISYNINGFKHLSELAMDYFPELSGPSAASKKMRACIKANIVLNEQMAIANFTDKTIDVSPEMQIILYRHWGPPKVSLPINVDGITEIDVKNLK